MFAVEDNSTCVEAILQEIVSGLQKLADPEAARAAQRFFPEKINCFGVRAADLRTLSQAIYDKVRAGWKIEQALELAESLFARPELEVRSCGLILLGRFQAGLNRPVLARIRRWLKKGYLDNWALIDTLCLEVLGPFFQRNLGQLKVLESWAGDKNVYVRRAALVSLIKLAREKKNLGFIFKAVRSAVPAQEADDLVSKAAGWLLREAGKTDRGCLEKFLLRYGQRLPRITVRYALEKFSPGKRSYFMRKTKV